MTDRENMKDLDARLSTTGNAEMINWIPRSFATWDMTEQQCLSRNADGEYEIGDRNYYPIPNHEAAYWLLKWGYRLPNELLAHEDEEKRKLAKRYANRWGFKDADLDGGTSDECRT